MMFRVVDDHVHRFSLMAGDKCDQPFVPSYTKSRVLERECLLWYYMHKRGCTKDSFEVPILN